jgi:calcineurin-like phosphoesterase family protein
MTIFFTSDQHFSHANIIQYCNRPFLSIEEMDAELVRRWNSVVKKNDWVWHLGDFTLGNKETADRWFRELNGSVHILANKWHHDSRWLGKMNDKNGYVTKTHLVFEWSSMVVLEAKPHLGMPVPIVLCHYPLAEWDRKHYKSWHLHGHSHGTYVCPKGSLALDVGVDSHDFYPISLEQVQQIMEQKEREDDGTDI